MECSGSVRNVTVPGSSPHKPNPREPEHNPCPADEGQPAPHQPQALGKTGRGNKREEAEGRQPEQGRRSSPSEPGRQKDRQHKHVRENDAARHRTVPHLSQGKEARGNKGRGRYFPSGPAALPATPASPAWQPAGPCSEGGPSPSSAHCTSGASPRATSIHPSAGLCAAHLPQQHPRAQPAPSTLQAPPPLCPDADRGDGAPLPRPAAIPPASSRNAGPVHSSQPHNTGRGSALPSKRRPSSLFPERQIIIA